MLTNDENVVNPDSTASGNINESRKKKGTNFTIIGIIIGVIVLVLITIIIIITILIKKKRNNKSEKEDVRQPETASIKTSPSKETKHFNDSTDEDIDFWL